MSLSTPAATLTALTTVAGATTFRTTTVYALPTASGDAAAPAPASTTKTTSDVPVAAIAGGAVAGVALAVAAVIVWHLWGRSIKRKEREKRKQAFAFWQLKENTRRNASGAAKHYDSYKPPPQAESDRKVTVKFISPTSRTSSKDSAETAVSENEKSDAEATVSPSPVLPSAPRGRSHAPARPSPLAKSVTPPSPSSPTSPMAETRPLMITRPLAKRSETEASTSTTATRRTGNTLDVPRLNHKSSNASSISMYSTQSGEERQMRVPPSLIMAALSPPDPSRPIIAEYTPVTRLSAAEYDERNRLSSVSSSSQPDGVGFAK